MPFPNSLSTGNYNYQYEGTIEKYPFDNFSKKVYFSLRYTGRRAQKSYIDYTSKYPAIQKGAK